MQRIEDPTSSLASESPKYRNLREALIGKVR